MTSRLLLAPNHKARGWVAGLCVCALSMYITDRIVGLKAGSDTEWMAWGPILVGAWVGWASYKQPNPVPLLAAPWRRLTTVSSETWWTVMQIIWGICVNLIEVVALVVVLEAGARNSQGLIVAGLALVYLTMTSYAMAQGRALLDLSMRTSRQFAAITQLLNDPEHPSTVADLKEAEEAIRRIDRRYWINAGFRSLMWLIALWYLFSAL